MEIIQLISEFIWEHKDPNNKIIGDYIIIPDFKLNSRVIVIKTARMGIKTGTLIKGIKLRSGYPPPHLRMPDF